MCYKMTSHDLVLSGGGLNKPALHKRYLGSKSVLATQWS